MFLPALASYDSQNHQQPIYLQEQTAPRDVSRDQACVSGIFVHVVFLILQRLCVCESVPLRFGDKPRANILPGNISCSQSYLLMCQKCLQAERAEPAPMPALPCALKSAWEATLCPQTANKQTNRENRASRRQEKRKSVLREL